MQARLAEGMVVEPTAVQDGETGPGRGDGGNEGLIEGPGGRRRDDDGKPQEPRELEFVVDRPGLPAVDLYVLSLFFSLLGRGQKKS